mmetsp:Transcript_43535/g.134889  ORF Transcript_43535/g.134889 Transcript_43535/m.134889 type:complete len:243 (-) Transcript_43535:9-737(-)
MLAGAPQHRIRLVLSGPHWHERALYDAAFSAAAQHADCDTPAVPHVFLRHLLGLRLAAALQEERHGGGGQRWGRGRAHASRSPHPCHQRSSGLRAHPGLWGRRVAGAARHLLAAARPAQRPETVGRLLCARTRGLRRGAHSHDAGAHHAALGPARLAVSRARDPRHRAGPGPQARGADQPVARPGCSPRGLSGRAARVAGPAAAGCGHSWPTACSCTWLRQAACSSSTLHAAAAALLYSQDY